MIESNLLVLFFNPEVHKNLWQWLSIFEKLSKQSLELLITHNFFVRIFVCFWSWCCLYFLFIHKFLFCTLNIFVETLIDPLLANCNYCKPYCLKNIKLWKSELLPQTQKRPQNVTAELRLFKKVLHNVVTFDLNVQL